MVKCKNCSGIFLSRTQMNDTSTWHKPILTTEINQECPNCGKTSSYTKEDHFFK